MAPTFSVAPEGQRLQGVLLKINDPVHAPLVAVNFYLLDGIEKASGRDLFAEAVKRKRNFQMFDKVSGTDEIRRQLKAGKSAAEVVESWAPGEEAFRRRRQKYLLYTDLALTKSAPTNESKPPAMAEPKTAPVVETRPAPPPIETDSTPQSFPPLIITVSNGDSAAKIAQDLGISASDIAEANPGVNLNRLKAGQKLKIPRTQVK